MSPLLPRFPFFLHIGCGISWWLCLFSLNWHQKTEIIYFTTFLSPFFVLYALWIIIPLLSLYIHKDWIRVGLMLVDVITLITFGLYALSWPFFRSFVLAYLSINAGNRYSDWGLPLAITFMLASFLGIWLLKTTPQDPTSA